jgi:hypothetical protein
MSVVGDDADVIMADPSCFEIAYGGGGVGIVVEQASDGL